jgi:hypothetical protein
MERLPALTGRLLRIIPKMKRGPITVMLEILLQQVATGFLQKTRFSITIRQKLVTSASRLYLISATSNFHTHQTKIGLYVLAGFGMTWYDTKINATGGSGNYSSAFNSITNISYDNRGDIKSKLKDVLDDSYETPAQTNDDRDGKSRFSGTFGAGIAFRLSRRFNIALEDRITFPER